jgi:hypothetical protein
VTWSHWLRTAPSGQTSVTRSAPPAPAPGRKEIVGDSVTEGHAEGSAPLPARNKKSDGPGAPGRPTTSIMTPLMPRE